jgi:AAA+ ATPase superfamily predicted ATPase
MKEGDKNTASGPIIGREGEQEQLKELMGSKKAEFIAVYGRRRIGKTYLIKNYIDSFSCVFFHVTGIQNGPIENQLEVFAKALGIGFYQGAPIAARERWFDAFQDLTDAIAKVLPNKKIVLFFDEFPWMATPRSKLLMALEHYWNQYWGFDKRIKLIICGSATSWIIKNIINNKGGLHNRATCTLHLKPFSLYETEKFLKDHTIHLSKRQILDLYSVLGGVPLYWSFIRKGQSAQQNIDRLCFQSGSILVKEFERLFSSIFTDAKPYIEFIRIIAKYRYGISQAQLIERSHLTKGGTAVEKLRELEEAGFITSLTPYKHKDKGIYYLVDDEYCLFYLHWIEPNLKSIAKKELNKGFWVSQSKQPSWKSWEGYAFEAICYKHIAQIRRALKIDPGATVGTWRYISRSKTEEGAQIDLLFDRLDNTITICEIKCSDSPFSIDKAYAQALLKKMDVFRKHSRTKKQLFLAMITTMGLKATMYSEEIVTNQVVLEDLFKEIS